LSRSDGRLVEEAESEVRLDRNGETGKVKLGFEGALTRFNNLVREQDAQPTWGLPTRTPMTNLPNKQRSLHDEP
jgi:hypothetical protein